MAVPNEYQDVLDLLTQHADALAWLEGRSGEVIARLPDYVVSLSINPFTELFNNDLGIKSPVTFQLLLPEGIEVGKFETRPDEQDYHRVRGLYDAATAGALKKREMLRQVEERLRGVSARR
jgi:hypothetical protein